MNMFDSDHTGRDDVEISPGGGQAAYSHMFIHETNVQWMLYSML